MKDVDFNKGYAYVFSSNYEHGEKDLTQIVEIELKNLTRAYSLLDSKLDKEFTNSMLDYTRGKINAVIDKYVLFEETSKNINDKIKLSLEHSLLVTNTVVRSEEKLIEFFQNK
jgi:hypothetical protein